MKFSLRTCTGFIIAALTQTLIPAIAQQPTVVVEGKAPQYVAPNTLDRIGRIWAPVMINGKGPFRLVLDTGASGSSVIGPVVDRLGLQPQPGKARLVGVTGAAEVDMVKVDSMEVGTIMLGGGLLPIVPDVFGGAEGTLAPRNLSGQRVFVDFRNDQIQITRSTGKAAEPGFSRVRFDVDRRQLIVFDIRVGGVKTKAILSTGGQRTIGNVALRDALLKRAREGKEDSIVGVTLDVATGQNIAVPPISLGDLSFRNVRITFGDVMIFEQWKMREPAMMIGMDIIGSLDAMVIDYKMEELHLRARR